MGTELATEGQVVAVHLRCTREGWRCPIRLHDCCRECSFWVRCCCKCELAGERRCWWCRAGEKVNG